MIKIFSTLIIFLILLLNTVFSQIILTGRILNIDKDNKQIFLADKSNKQYLVSYNISTSFYLNNSLVFDYKFPKFKDVVIVLYSPNKPYIAKAVYDLKTYNMREANIDIKDIDEVDKLIEYNNKIDTPESRVVIHRYNYYGYMPYSWIDPYFYDYFPYWWGYIQSKPSLTIPYKTEKYYIKKDNSENKSIKKSDNYVSNGKINTYEGYLEDIGRNFVVLKTKDTRTIKLYFSKFTKIYSYRKGSFSLQTINDLSKGLFVRVTVRENAEKRELLNIFIYRGK